MKKFRVHLQRDCRGSGSWTEAAYVDVEAETKEEAESKALAEVDDEDFNIDEACDNTLFDDNPELPTVERCWEIGPKGY